MSGRAGRQGHGPNIKAYVLAIKACFHVLLAVYFNGFPVQYCMEKQIGGAFLQGFSPGIVAFLRAFLAFLRLFSEFYLVNIFSVHYSTRVSYSRYWVYFITTVGLLEISPPN